MSVPYARSLFPLATVVTPNLPEAEALLEGDSIKNLKDMEDAAQKLHSRGPQFVLIKGGHLEGAVHAHYHSEVDIRYYCLVDS